MRYTMIITLIISSLLFGTIADWTLYEDDAIAFQAAFLRRTLVNINNVTVGICTGSATGTYYSLKLSINPPERFSDPRLIAAIIACGEISAGTTWQSYSLNVTNYTRDEPWCWTTEFCREVYWNHETWDDETLWSKIESHVIGPFGY